MVRQHNQLNGHELDQTPGDSEGWWSGHAAVYEVAKSWT